jgi:O-antigen/teichoic acid export membrane protein
VFRRLLSFVASVGLITLVGLIAIPALIATVGAQTWGSLSVLQVLGGIFGVLVAFGWGVTGPSMIAAAPPTERPTILREATVTRVCLYALSALVMIALGSVLLHGDVALAAAGSLTYLLAYVASPWYFVGEARPDRLFFLNTLPAAAGTAAGLLLAALTHSALWFLGAQALGYLLAIVLELAVVLRVPHDGEPLRLGLRRVVETLAAQRHAVTSSLVSTLYVSLPLVAVQALAAPLVPTYAMADRLFKFASVALSPFQQFFQGWVPETGEAHIPERAPKAAQAGLGLGLLGGALVAALSPFASGLLSGGAVHVPLAVSIPLGIAFAAIACSALIGYACLTLLGGIRFVARGSIIAAAIGAPLIVLAAAIPSLPLVASAVALSEVVVAVYQAIILRRLLAQLPPPEPSST